MGKPSKSPGTPVRSAAKTRNGKANGINPDTARRLAIEYCLFHYPTLYTGGLPKRGAHPATNIWIVPIMLEDPEAGISEPVGELRIDAKAKEVVASTPAAEVVTAGKRLYEERRHARRIDNEDSRIKPWHEFAP